MVGEDKVMMSGRELRRVHVIRQAMDKKLRQREAGALLGLTVRQVRRLIKRVRAAGEAGLAHRGRGRPSNRRHAPALKARVLRLYDRHYGDFGPTLAAEKLAERHGITRSAETLRGWLLEKGVDHFRRRKRPHRAWRERKAHVGELVQLDGAHHDWLDGRGPQGVLMAYIDDASSRVFARFYEYEGTIPALDGFRQYIPAVWDSAGRLCGQAYDLPVASQADRGGAAGRGGTDESVGAGAGRTGGEPIPAHSPQAKGRVERLFKTFQDRLIQELRLAGIATLEEANRFLEGYLPIYNRRFSVQPAPATDLHRPRLAGRDLDRILCIKTTRCRRRDWTVAHHGHLYQVRTNVRTTHVMVEERLDGTRRITHQGRPLDYHDYHAITARPERVAEPPKGPRPPASDQADPTHPWRTRLLSERGPHAAAAGT